MIVYDYPASQAALARLKPADPAVAERFELYLSTASNWPTATSSCWIRRCCEPARPRRIATAWPTASRALPEESRLLEAMEAGLPPCAGVALGFDRAVMLATGAELDRRSDGVSDRSGVTIDGMEGQSMKRSLRPGRWFRTVLVGIVLAALHGSAASRAIAQEEKLSWDSPKMREVESEWHSLEDTNHNTPEQIPGDQPKSKYDSLLRLQDSLLKKRLSDRDLQHLAEAVGPIPYTEFTNQVVDCIVWSFLQNKEREGLVTLLSKRCTGRVGAGTIEYALAYRGYKFKDPILVLGEAYSKCQSPETRHNLAAAIRRGFSGNGIPFNGDADFVERALQWYEHEKEHLEVNVDYLNNDAGPGLERYERNPKFYEEFPPPFKRERLFEKKASAEGAANSDRTAGQITPERIVDDAKRAAPTTAEKELAKLQGTWEILNGTSEGQPVSHGVITNNRILFREDAIEWRRNFPAGAEREEFQVRLDVQQRPIAIDLIGMLHGALKKEQTTPLIYELQEKTMMGIYDLKGDTLRVCLSSPGATHRPTSFKTEKGSRDISYIWKRIRE